MNDRHSFIIPAVIFTVAVSVVGGFLAVRGANQLTSAGLEVDKIAVGGAAMGVNGTITTSGAINTAGGVILNTAGAAIGLYIPNGNVGIGTVPSGYKLYVSNGDVNWPAILGSNSVGVGVQGWTSGTDANMSSGVYGRSGNASVPAIRGYNSTGGSAGYFEGDLKATGKLTIDGNAGIHGKIIRGDGIISNGRVYCNGPSGLSFFSTIVFVCDDPRVDLLFTDTIESYPVYSGLQTSTTNLDGGGLGVQGGNAIRATCYALGGTGVNSKQAAMSGAVYLQAADVLYMPEATVAEFVSPLVSEVRIWTSSGNRGYLAVVTCNY